MNKRHLDNLPNENHFLFLLLLLEMLKCLFFTAVVILILAGFCFGGYHAVFILMKNSEDEIKQDEIYDLMGCDETRHFCVYQNKTSNIYSLHVLANNIVVECI